MKKIITILMTIGVIFGLAACGTNNDTNSAESNEIEDSTEVTKDEGNTNEVDSEEESEQSKEGNSTNTSNENENCDSKTQNNKEEENNTEEENSKNEEFKESEVIEKEIDVSDLNVEIETDNDNNRVILFKENNKPVYKTVYIKRDQRLKIIDIENNEGQIYNKIIES